MIDVRTLNPPDKEDIKALLADWPEPDSPYIAVNKRWLVSKDGKVYEYHARGTHHIPGDPNSGVWCEDMLIAWTGQWRDTPEGHRRKCTIGIPMVRGMNLDELLKGRKLYRLDVDSETEEPAPPPEFDPAIIARRKPAPVDELAEQGVQAAEAVGT